ncbi:MAG: aminotransferase class I/II-fold pyridoxal phosphate-dependent enzyme [Chloroflexi bacterium]|nr:aminotransferase class I/II-fold pyridoxal phosphate-dependent enzyme [Chloroflexota bacterium]MCY3696213.1 aminotransferase class I/II-fold pyridoxal phosphate-dependent enzyme [Chloroflexota bacterium]MYB23253.1 aminotransferase class I/II-fold pyridoxal phosphate-dependent enzyme [Chloroflexota bacterium]MYF81157.1 aminotransferase class I/II-fold pyridoxal phosphate-dependent enzyme [Chloroflexota bacterium]MYI04677.1 aminotransferase class I/II-fold pyridoxal phosphate-dependent enzyme 
MPIASNDRSYASDDDPRRTDAAGAGSASAAGATGEHGARRESRVAERVQAVPSSGIRRFFDIIASMDHVISLGVGEPDFVTPWPISEAGIRAIERGHTHYTSNLGLLELREAIASDLERRYGVEWDPIDELLITTGVSEGLDLAARAIINPGDEVIVADPSYAAHAPAILLAGGAPVAVPTSAAQGFALEPDRVEAAITHRTRALLLGYPSNPTGAVLDRPTLEALSEIAQRHDLLVISDEIYDRLVYGGAVHTPIASLPGMKERTITLGGFSKSHAMTGWRVAWAAAPADLFGGMLKIHQYAMMSAPTVAQYAALEAVRAGEEYVVSMREEYDRRRQLMWRGFNDLGLACAEPRGAFYAFPSVAQTGYDDETFAEQLLLREQVAVVPGSAFGAAGAGHVRACYATSYAEIEEALERIRRFLHSAPMAK